MTEELAAIDGAGEGITRAPRQTGKNERLRLPPIEFINGYRQLVENPVGHGAANLCRGLQQGRFRCYRHFLGNFSDLQGQVNGDLLRHSQVDVIGDGSLETFFLSLDSVNSNR